MELGNSILGWFPWSDLETGPMHLNTCKFLLIGHVRTRLQSFSWSFSLLHGVFSRFSGEFSSFSWQEVYSGSTGEILVIAAKRANTGLLFIYCATLKCPRCFGDFTHAEFWVLKENGILCFTWCPFWSITIVQVLKIILTSLEVTNSLESNNFFICSHTGLVMDCPKAAATGSQSPEIRYQILNGDFFS